mmetsp:Transcript_11272/g.27557  ORF Transcript_11272/g.27557 Transcript_11272/m.27557 type:complete len:1794 (-) Transcript_11272:133-5514(-)
MTDSDAVSADRDDIAPRPRDQYAESDSITTGARKENEEVVRAGDAQGQDSSAKSKGSCTVDVDSSSSTAAAGPGRAVLLAAVPDPVTEPSAPAPQELEMADSPNRLPAATTPIQQLRMAFDLDRARERFETVSGVAAEGFESVSGVARSVSGAAIERFESVSEVARERLKSIESMVPEQVAVVAGGARETVTEGFESASSVARSVTGAAKERLESVGEVAKTSLETVFSSANHRFRPEAMTYESLQHQAEEALERARHFKSLMLAYHEQVQASTKQLSAAELRRLYTTQTSLLVDYVQETFLWRRVLFAAVFFGAWFWSLYSKAVAWADRGVVVRPFWFSPVFATWLYLVVVYFGVRLMGRRAHAISSYIFEFLFIYNVAQIVANGFIFGCIFFESRKLQGSPRLFLDANLEQNVYATYGGKMLQPVIGDSGSRSPRAGAEVAAGGALPSSPTVTSTSFLLPGTQGFYPVEEMAVGSAGAGEEHVALTMFSFSSIANMNLHLFPKSGIFSFPFSIFTTYVVAPVLDYFLWPVQLLVIRPLLVNLFGLNLRYFTAWWGNGRDCQSDWLSVLVWFHYMLHVTELCDILFVILRKKYQRILTSLHIYLRILNLWSWFLASRYGSYGDVGFVVLVNSATNFFVYWYYATAILKKRRQEVGGAPEEQHDQEPQPDQPQFVSSTTRFPAARGAPSSANVRSTMGMMNSTKLQVVRLQVFQMTTLFAHALYCLFFGQMPALACLWQIFVMLQGLILYLDFQQTTPTSTSSKDAAATLTTSAAVDHVVEDLLPRRGAEDFRAPPTDLDGADSDVVLTSSMSSPRPGTSCKERPPATSDTEVMLVHEALAKGLYEDPWPRPCHSSSLDINKNRPMGTSSGQPQLYRDESFIPEVDTSDADDAASSTCPASSPDQELRRRRHSTAGAPTPAGVPSSSRRGAASRDGTPTGTTSPSSNSKIARNYHLQLSRSMPQLAKFLEQRERIRRSKNRKPKLMFSFDSSGWLYLYHFGVAYAIESHFGRLTQEDLDEYNRETKLEEEESELRRKLHADLKRTVLPGGSCWGGATTGRAAAPGRGIAEVESVETSNRSTQLQEEPRSPTSSPDVAAVAARHRSGEGRDHQFSHGAPGPVVPAKDHRVGAPPSSDPFIPPLRLPDSLVSNRERLPASSSSGPQSASTSSNCSSSEQTATSSESTCQQLPVPRRDVMSSKGSTVMPFSSKDSSHAHPLPAQSDAVVDHSQMLQGSRTPGAPAGAQLHHAHVHRRPNPACLGFSGSSGGALVGTALATGIDIRALAEYAISLFPTVGHNPCLAIKALDGAMRKFVEPGMFKRASNRAIILLTNVRVTKPPFLTAETVSDFQSDYHLKSCLKASSHVPLAAGWLPFKMTPEMLRDENDPDRRTLTKTSSTAGVGVPLEPSSSTSGIDLSTRSTTASTACTTPSQRLQNAATSHYDSHSRRQQKEECWATVTSAARTTTSPTSNNSAASTCTTGSVSWYIDGLAWLTFLVPWRTFHPDDSVIKVSALSAPFADIVPRIIIPLWWAAFPPSQKVLKGIFWSGYQDAMLWIRDTQYGYENPRSGRAFFKAGFCGERDPRVRERRARGYYDDNFHHLRAGARASHSVVPNSSNSSSCDSGSGSGLEGEDHFLLGAGRGCGRGTGAAGRQLGAAPGRRGWGKRERADHDEPGDGEKDEDGGGDVVPTRARAAAGAPLPHRKKPKPTARQVLRRLLPREKSLPAAGGRHRAGGRGGHHHPFIWEEDPDLWEEILEYIDEYEEQAESAWTTVIILTLCATAILLLLATEFEL